MGQFTKNAIIAGTFLGVEDHGIMTFMLQLDYGGSNQGFGGYALDEYDKENDTRVFTVVGGEAIKHILRVVGVRCWEHLKGKPIRVIGTKSKIDMIGNILKDEWFAFEDVLEGKVEDES